ncbi:MAG TPA: A/G-specific adenine glycosylase [Candidatus Paceibacterota bacterium]|nr:A/G-specific adenine glycosylase [Candidatus Paceibacterota bacterium]
MNPKRFKAIILDYYRKSGRHDLPWRKTRDPYRILVSETMLQQTQVPRVLKKYEEFLAEFPTASDLAKAPTAQVLRIWQGLGYNRRALLLKRAAESVIRDFGGKFPKTADDLESLPGIGQSTRGAIMAFAFDIPTVFIETNIRAVFLHFFFKDKKGVNDKKVLPLIEKTLDRRDPRAWYYALMDYGVYLKRILPNPSRRSAHHAKQSPFKGSNREIRARIVKFVLGGARTEKEIADHIGKTRHDVQKNIRNLVAEGFMKETEGRYEA